MSIFDACKTGEVFLTLVNIDNDYFKISKPVSEKLRNSIKSLGLLEKPILLNENGKYAVVYGHNRLAVLHELNISLCSAVVLNLLNPKDYIGIALHKNYRGEIGCIGKIKFIWILKNKFSLDDKDIFSAAEKMQIPQDFLDNNLIEKILNLPQLLKIYIDSRDLGFKAIKNILHLPDDVLLLLTKWTADSNMRINFFKGITDLVFDIYKRDKSISGLKNIDSAFLQDNRKKEEFLYNEIYKIRYPEFTDIKFRAMDLIGGMSKKGIEIDFPEFLGKDEIKIILKINKRDEIELLKRRLNQIDLNSIKALLELL